MKLHIWLLFVSFLIAQIGGGAVPCAGGESRSAGHQKSCGMSCCKLVADTEACGCMEAPGSAPDGRQPMQTAPAASRAQQPSMTTSVPPGDFISQNAPVEIETLARSPGPSGKGKPDIGLPVLFCSFLI